MNATTKEATAKTVTVKATKEAKAVVTIGAKSRDAIMALCKAHQQGTLFLGQDDEVTQAIYKAVKADLLLAYKEKYEGFRSDAPKGEEKAPETKEYITYLQQCRRVILGKHTGTKPAIATTEASENAEASELSLAAETAPDANLAWVEANIDTVVAFLRAKGYDVKLVA